jgi:predicted methyltransferase
MEKIKIKILNELAISKKSLWELLDTNNDFLLKDFLKAIKDLCTSGFVEADEKGFNLTSKGKKFVKKSTKLFRAIICKKCLGKRILFNENFKDVFEEYKKIVANRPLPTLKFSQGYMNEYDVILRVTFMHYYNDLVRKDFILIGDDDLLSVALALTELPSRICVLDIDERIGEFLIQVNKEYGFEIEFQKYNVSDPLPKKYLGKFDVFSSEPLETLSGLKAFLLRGISSLKKNGSGYFGLTVAECSYKKWIKIEKFLTRMNCVITDLIKDFSRYSTSYETIDYETFAEKLQIPIGKNPGIEWYKSALFRFKLLDKPEALMNKKLHIDFVDPEEEITVVQS